MLHNDIITQYSHLWRIEKVFQISKTDLRIRPIYHRKEGRIKAHICISFVAYTIIKELETILKENEIDISVNKAIDEIKNIIVANQEGRLIKLSDVATVADSFGEQRSLVRTNGTPSVMVAVQKQSGTNTVDVAKRAKQAMDKVQVLLPPDIKVIVTRDSAVYIKDSVDDVMMSMVFGGFLAVVITFLFLQNTRATIIGAIAIPTSVIATFFLLKTMHFTLNNMSLMGLSLAVGILIDDAIVVIENIYRHMEEGKSALEAAKEGTREIALAVMATTLSILAVFVPVGSMGGIVGQYFKQFGLTVAFAVAFSLFVAFTLTPTLSAYWLKNHPMNSRFFLVGERWYK